MWFKVWSRHYAKKNFKGNKTIHLINIKTECLKFHASTMLCKIRNIVLDVLNENNEVVQLYIV